MKSSFGSPYLCAYRMSFVCVLVFAPIPEVGAQHKSVKPGVNKAYEDPNVIEFVERFESEGREVYDQRNKIVQLCRIRPGDQVADIGAGTGLFTRLFSDAVGRKGRVYAVDIAENFIRHIEQSSRSEGRTNVVGVVCQADDVTLPPHCVDVAFICDTYHHFEFPQKTMRTLRQALKPDGRVIVVDFERIPGVSSDWVLGHVRAGKEMVIEEIESSGFELIEETDGLLQENYLLHFRKAGE